MEHILIQLIHLGIFNQIAQIHHTDLVTDMAHHGQIVTDKQIGKAVFILQFFQNIDYLCLDGHIKCRNRLVTYNELRIGCQRPGNSDPLTLSAGKLMWITVQVISL